VSRRAGGLQFAVVVFAAMPRLILLARLLAFPAGTVERLSPRAAAGGGDVLALDVAAGHRPPG
jgi:hypothetical protein